MLSLTISTLTSTQWLVFVIFAVPLLYVMKMAYNLFLHPMAHIPGPFWCRASGFPSWYYTMNGKRHVWLWQQFQIYGNKLRAAPNLVVFHDPAAFPDIFGHKANVQRSIFYRGMERSSKHYSTFSTIDKAAHAKRRKLLNMCFTDKMMRGAAVFIQQHVDRWNELMLSSSKGSNGAEWSDPVNFAELADHLVWDIMTDLCFGKSFNIKEPGDNPLKIVPPGLSKLLRHLYPFCRSPLLAPYLWLQPHGLDWVLGRLEPPLMKMFYKVIEESVATRIQLFKDQSDTLGKEKRQDMMHFLLEARDPDTGLPAFKVDGKELIAEANLLVAAGSDTTAVSLSSVMFNITLDNRRYKKLIDEIRTTFESADDIVHGPQLQSCIYLTACINESMRLAGPVTAEPPREVLKGGATIMGEHYPEGTIVGMALWPIMRSQEIYGDPDVFRPERWIVDEAAGNTEEDVARYKTGFQPFVMGPTGCVGKNLALMEMSLVLARTLFRMDVRRSPGSTLGAGSPEFMWGERDKKQMLIEDCFIGQRVGPELQFRKRQ